jgi:hypothetical protein
VVCQRFWRHCAHTQQQQKARSAVTCFSFFAPLLAGENSPYWSIKEEEKKKEEEEENDSL